MNVPWRWSAAFHEPPLASVQLAAVDDLAVLVLATDFEDVGVDVARVSTRFIISAGPRRTLSAAPAGIAWSTSTGVAGAISAPSGVAWSTSTPAGIARSTTPPIGFRTDDLERASVEGCFNRTEHRKRAGMSYGSDSGRGPDPTDSCHRGQLVAPGAGEHV